MAWEVVKIDSSRQGKNTAYVSVGFGRLALSSAACDLIKDFNEYKYAQLLKDRKEGKLLIGIKLYKEFEANTIKIGKRKFKGTVIEKSLLIDNKRIIEDLFGIQGAQNKSTRYPIILDENDKTLLIIHGN